MMLRKWESWVVFRRDDEQVGERMIRRHFTRRGAQHWADTITHNPDILAATMRSVLVTPPDADGISHFLFADSDVRMRKA